MSDESTILSRSSGVLVEALGKAKKIAVKSLSDPASFVTPAAGIGKRAAVAALLPVMDSPVIEEHKNEQGKAPEDFRGYSPLVPDLVPTGIYNLYNGVAAITGLPQAQVGYLDRANDRIDKADESLREFFDVGPVSNPLDLAVEVAGSLVVPGPKRVPRVPQSVNAAAKAAQGAVKPKARIATVLNESGKIAAESMLPFRQGSTLRGAVAVQAPLAVGTMEGLDAVVQTPEYNSIREAITNSPDPVEKPQEPSIYDYMTPEQFQEFERADPETQRQIISAVAQAIAIEQAHDPAIVPDTGWFTEGLAAAGIIATLGGGVYGTRALARHHAAQRLKNVGELQGVNVDPQYTEVYTNLIAKGIQHDQALRAAAKEFEDVEYQKYLAKLDAVTLSPLNAKISHAFGTGELPNSNVSTRPLGPLLNAMVKDLNPIEQRMVDEALMARSALDDFKRTGVQSAFNDKTPAELEQMAQRVEGDPRLAEWARKIKVSYNDQLDYLVEQGLISWEARKALAQKRPNYIHMRKQDATVDANPMLWGNDREAIRAQQTLDNLFTRSIEEGGGVQAGEAGSPARSLPTTWSAIIKRAESNRVQVDFLNRAANNAALKDFVIRLPDGQTPNDMSNIVTVMEGGKTVHFRVSDIAIKRAFEFTPGVTENTLSILFSVPKKVKETFTTGWAAPEFGMTSAFYDTVTGIALRPKGYDLGLFAELKNRLVTDPNSTGSKIAGEIITAIDPTKFVSAPVGAVRLAYANLVHSMGRELSEQLMRQGGWFYQKFGPQATKHWADVFAKRYAATPKSIADEYGAVISNYFMPTGPENVPAGLLDLAPKFYSESSHRAYEEALKGNTNWLAKTAKLSGNGFNQAKANGIARVYMSTVRLMPEGFRYQALATNLPKILADGEMAELIAMQTRRLAADPTQTGADIGVQHAQNSLLYARVSLQTPAQIGRQLVDQPITTLVNITSMIVPMTALYIAAIASDPEKAERARNMTDEEATRTLITPIADIPISPDIRPLWGPLVATLNELSGLNYGEFDPNLLAVIDKMFDDEKDFTEPGMHSLRESALRGLGALSPVTPGSSPTINALAATMGGDLGFSRFGEGGIRDLKGQTLDTTGGDGRLVDDAMSAVEQKMLQDLIGGHVSAFVRMSLDAHRVVDAGGTKQEAFDVAMSRLKDNQVAKAGPLRGILFPDYERAQSVNDTSFSLWYKKKEGIELARTTLRQIESMYYTGNDPRGAMLRPMDLVKPENAGSALVPIGELTADLARSIRTYEEELSELREADQNEQNRIFASIEERNKERNRINERRRIITEQLIIDTQMVEDQIREMIGDPTFTYQNFDPAVYAEMPYPPPPASLVGAVSSPQAPPAR